MERRNKQLTDKLADLTNTIERQEEYLLDLRKDLHMEHEQLQAENALVKRQTMQAQQQHALLMQQIAQAQAQLAQNANANVNAGAAGGAGAGANPPPPPGLPTNEQLAEAIANYRAGAAARQAQAGNPGGAGEGNPGNPGNGEDGNAGGGNGPAPPRGNLYIPPPYQNFDTMSNLSDNLGEARGLGKVIRHLSAPLTTLLDINRRDNPDYLAQGTGHLQTLTPDYIQAALKKDQVIINQNKRIDNLTMAIENLTELFSKMQNENKTSVNSITEKTGKILPLPLATYPVEPADEAVYMKSVVAMDHVVRNIDKTVPLNKFPHDYLLEICGVSNSIVSNFRLNRQQHRQLIMSFVNSTHTLYRELSLLSNIDQIFSFANLACTSTYTRLELDNLLETWKLNYENNVLLNESISNLKTILINATGLSIDRIDQTTLYLDMLKRIRREKLPPFTIRQLDETRLQVEVESDPIELHRLILAPLKSLCSFKTRKATAVHTHAMSVEPLLSSSVADRSSSVKDFKKKSKNNKKKNKTFMEIKPWPKNKPYTKPNSNTLTQECENYFHGFCFSCGKNNHIAEKCWLYNQEPASLSLCKTCFRGFHSVCKYKGKGKNKPKKALSQKRKSRSRSRDRRDSERSRENSKEKERERDLDRESRILRLEMTLSEIKDFLRTPHYLGPVGSLKPINQKMSQSTPMIRDISQQSVSGYETD